MEPFGLAAARFEHPPSRRKVAGTLRIGELAGQLGLNPRTIRYYESIGLLPEPERTESGYRDYDGGAIELLTFIKTAQRLGITLDEIREIIALRDRGEQPCGYVRDVLRRQVGDIDERIAELRHLRRELVTLEDLVDQLPDAGPAPCQLIEHAQLLQRQAEARSEQDDPGNGPQLPPPRRRAPATTVAANRSPRPAGKRSPRR